MTVGTFGEIYLVWPGDRIRVLLPTALHRNEGFLTTFAGGGSPELSTLADRAGKAPTNVGLTPSGVHQVEVTRYGDLLFHYRDPDELDVIDEIVVPPTACGATSRVAFLGPQPATLQSCDVVFDATGDSRKTGPPSDGSRVRICAS